MTTHPRLQIQRWAASLLLLLTTAAGAPSCAPSEPPGPEGAVRIGVSIPPLAWVARGLAPPDAVVEVIVPAGVSPHSFEPTPSQLVALRDAEVVVIVGLGLEPQVERALRRNPSNHQLVVIFATEAGADAHEHDDEESHTHDHDGHAHGPVDPHLWLDPVLMESLVRAVRQRVQWAMERRGPLDEAELARLDAAEASLLAEAALIATEYVDALAPFDSPAVVTMHDAWGRLADRTGFRVAGELLRAGEMEATPGSVERAARLLREAGARVVVVEPQHDAQIARRVAAAAGAQVAVMDPLGDGDWPATMRANLAALVTALEAAGAGGTP